MASKRQIEANRRNARKSTGPRSSGGKKRARRNSYRHGLSSGVSSSAEFAKNVEVLAQKIAGSGADTITLNYARSAAQAVFDLEQIRRAKVSLIQRMSAFSEFEQDWKAFVRHDISEIRRAGKALRRGDPLFYPLPNPSPPKMPSSEPERTAEAVRRALPELLKLNRYERRAAAIRDQATRRVIGRKLIANSI
jgi:hypothetical protein